METRIIRNLSKSPICGIYSVTNIINNKIYIGQSIDIERRWLQHKYGKGNIILRNAIKKYGINNFKFGILESIDTSKISKDEIVSKLMDLEQKWFDIKEPFLKENGYNIQKTSKPNLTPNKDKHFGEKISKIKIENNHTGKPLNQYDLNGKLIKEWKSAAEVERILGFKSENISACCLGKQNSSHSFIWKFNNYCLIEKDLVDANSSLRLSEVRQYNLRGNLLAVFKNTKEASKITGIKETIIREACNKTKKTGNGFIWKFKNEPLVLLEHINKKDFPIKQISKFGEIKIWNNVYEAIKELELSKYGAKNIYKCCDGELSRYLGYKWKWNMLTDLVQVS